MFPLAGLQPLPYLKYRIVDTFNPRLLRILGAADFTELLSAFRVFLSEIR